MEHACGDECAGGWDGDEGEVDGWEVIDTQCSMNLCVARTHVDVDDRRVLADGFKLGVLKLARDGYQYIHVRHWKS